MKYKKRRVFIVGGLGFLGKETAKLLKKYNYEVIIADLPSRKKNILDENKFVSLDLRNIDSIKNLDILQQDIIVNLASRQYQNKVSYFERQKWFDEVNFNGAIHLLEKAINCGASGYIFFSSDMVYGLQENLPIKENYNLKPLAEYGKSKEKAEKELNKLANCKIPLTIFRPRLISGPGRLGVFEKLFSFIKYSLPVPIIGNGSNYYQMISVYDCAKAILLSIEKDFPNEIFNLGSDKLIMVKDLIKELINYSNSKSKIIFCKSNIINPFLYMFDFIGFPLLYPEQFLIADKNNIIDITKTKKYLKWEPEYDDQLMINKSYDYWLKLKK